MRAARYHGRKDVRIEDIPIPTPGPDQYLIEVAWCGICGSDLHEYMSGPVGIPTKERPHPLTGGYMPVTIGHEICGRVKEIPSSSSLQVTDTTTTEQPPSVLRVGDAVMIDPHFTCGKCASCLDDDVATSGSSDHLCADMGFLGSSGAGGGLSEYIAVDAAMVHRLPAGVDLDDAAIIEPLAVAHHAIKVASQVGCRRLLPSESSVLVVGGGPIGYAVALTLRAHGATMVVLSEPALIRREFAQGVASVIIDPVTMDVGEVCRGLTAGRGVDVVFDCAGVKRGSESAFDAIRPGGTFVNVAMWSPSISIPYTPFFRKEVKFLSSCCYNRQDFREVMQLMEQGKFKGFGKMVTGRIALEDLVVGGFEELIQNKDKHVKILVSPRKPHS